MVNTVDVATLAQHAAGFGFAYLITINPKGRIHTSVVRPSVGDGTVTIAEASGRSCTNAAEHPEVSLVWPPADAGGYSLIVDGTAAASDSTLVVTPSRAILHRPALEPAEPDGEACVQDCIEF